MKKFALIPVMFCFFAMGFVDLVGIASLQCANGYADEQDRT